MASPVVATEPQAHASPFKVNAKRPFVQNGRTSKKLKSKRERDMTDGTVEEVLLADVQALLKSRRADSPVENGTNGSTEAVAPSLPEPGSQIDVEVLELSSTGDGLAIQQGSASPQIYVIPFVVPGDVARIKVFKHFHNEGYTMSDFISVITPSPLRDDSRISCKYFTKCSGCQFQMLDYAEQLRHKKSIVVKAYQNFSQLPPELVPGILDTMGSPLQYGYRTKLTPHFDGPKGNPRKKSLRQPFKEVPNVGFNEKGRRNVLDIEDCPIGTDAVRLGMKRERERMGREFGNYKSGATILLRESTKRYPKGGDEQPPAEIPEDQVRVETERYTDIKSCTTDNKAMTSEYIDDFAFTNPAGSFFQNNNSILSPFTAYVRDLVLPRTPSPSGKEIKYLIDAYSGSGLFTITLSGMFKSSQGIDIAADSIEYARKNALLNSIPEAECSFIASDAPQLFQHVTYDADETVVVLDPPRKGCDASFLGQLLQFGPRRIVYVSCNVHTQARDVGILVRGEVEGWQPEANGDGPASAPKKKSRYDIESIRGFDFFPQTGHVEGVAILNRVEE